MATLGRVSDAETARRHQRDFNSDPILYEGATQAQLQRLFRLSGPTVKARMTKVKPCGNRDGYPIYHVYDAAPALTRLEDAEVLERLLRMNAEDLPKALSREYWNGQIAKLNYEERVGDLWNTRDIVELASDAFKTMRLSLMLLADTLEREAEITIPQRVIVERVLDELLQALKGKLVSGFENRRDNPVSKSVAPGEDQGDDDL